MRMMPHNARQIDLDNSVVGLQEQLSEEPVNIEKQRIVRPVLKVKILNKVSENRRENQTRLVTVESHYHISKGQSRSLQLTIGAWKALI